MDLLQETIRLGDVLDDGQAKDEIEAAGREPAAQIQRVGLHDREPRIDGLTFLGDMIKTRDHDPGGAIVQKGPRRYAGL